MSNAYPQQQYPPQAPPKKSRTGLIVLAVIGVLALLGLAGCLAFAASLGDGEDPSDTVTAAPAASETGRAAGKPADEPSDEPAAKPYTLKVIKCARGQYGSFDVTVKITNNTDDQTTYFFDVGLYDPKGNTVGDGFGSIEVKPGKSGTTETFAYLEEDSYKGKVTCEIKVTDF